MNRIQTASWLVLIGMLAASCASWNRLAPPRSERPPAEVIRSTPSAPEAKVAPPPVTAAPVGEPPAARPPDGPVRVTLPDAVLMGLENNRALKLQRLTPELRRTQEDREAAVFDPVLRGEAALNQSKARQPGTSGGTNTVTELNGYSGKASVAKRFSSGTAVAIEGGATLADSPLYTEEFDTARAGISVTQALLKGRPVAVNRASLEQARLDTLSSIHELRGFAQDLVARIESGYWDYALAGRQIAIVSNSLQLAEQYLEDTRSRIAAGKLAGLELAAARAEAAQRREALILAQAGHDKARLNLLRLVNPPSSNLWQRPVELLTMPPEPEDRMSDVEAHWQLAERRRPDLCQARLAVQRGELEVVKTRNGLLPRLDLFIRLGSSGYAGSFGAAVGEVNGDYTDLSAGFALEYPLGNRDAEAVDRRAVLTRQQTVDALENLRQLAELDLRSAYIDASRSREQIAATRETRKLREETLRAETAKLGVGKSTTFLVAQSQRDLLAAQLLESQALANHLKAVIELHRQDGSLLPRRGIETFKE